MRIIFPVIFLILSLSLATLGQASASQIVGAQSLNRNAAIAFTRDSIFRSDADGENWVELATGKTSSQRIVEANFTDPQSGYILLADGRTSSLEIRRTSDDGITWSPTSVGIDLNSHGSTARTSGVS